MPKIDDLTYPDDTDDIMDSKFLAPVFRRFLERSSAAENLDFLVESESAIRKSNKKSTLTRLR